MIEIGKNKEQAHINYLLREIKEMRQKIAIFENTLRSMGYKGLT